VLVMDWGIAVDVSEQAGGQSRAPHKSTVTAPSGTPSYMAPELAEGRGSALGPHTDVYLLGAILHELLTGYPPHRGRTLMEVLLSSARSTPPVFPPGTPSGLAAICSKAMAREPSARHASAADLQRELAQWATTRDSQRITDTARQRLEGARVATAGVREHRYADFAEALAGFRQAQVLWPGNADAVAGEREARLAYAEAALLGGDLGLAEAQLQIDGADAAIIALRARVVVARSLAAAQARSARRNRHMLIVAMVAIMVGLALGTWLVDRQRRRAMDAQAVAERERQRAETQESEARKQRDVAEDQRRQADAAKEEALTSAAATRRQFAMQAIGERDHAQDNANAVLCWQAEALRRITQDSADARRLRMGLEQRLAARSAPHAVAKTEIMEGDGMVAWVAQIQATHRRDRVVVQLERAYDEGGGRLSPQSAEMCLAVWDPTQGDATLPLNNLDLLGYGGRMVVDSRGDRIVVQTPYAWVSFAVDATGNLRETARHAVATMDADEERHSPLADWSVDQCIFSPDGRWLVGVGDSGENNRLLVIDAATLAITIDRPAKDYNPSIAFTVDGRWALLREQRQCAIYDAQTWTAVVNVPVENGALAVHPQGTSAVVLSGKTRLQYAIKDGQWALVWKDETTPIDISDWSFSACEPPAIGFSADGKHLWRRYHSTGGIESLAVDPTTARPQEWWLHHTTPAAMGLPQPAWKAWIAGEMAVVGELHSLALAWPQVITSDAATWPAPSTVSAPHTWAGLEKGVLTYRLPATTDYPKLSLPAPWNERLTAVVNAVGGEWVALSDADGYALITLKDGTVTTHAWPVKPADGARCRIALTQDGQHGVIVMGVDGQEHSDAWRFSTREPSRLNGPQQIPSVFFDAALVANGELLLAPELREMYAFAQAATRPWQASDPGVIPWQGASPVRFDLGGQPRIAWKLPDGKVRVIEERFLNDVRVQIWEYASELLVAPARAVTPPIVLDLWSGDEGSWDVSADGGTLCVLHSRTAIIDCIDAANGSLIARIEANAVAAANGAPLKMFVKQVRFAGNEHLRIISADRDGTTVEHCFDLRATSISAARLDALTLLHTGRIAADTGGLRQAERYELTEAMNRWRVKP